MEKNFAEEIFAFSRDRGKIRENEFCEKTFHENKYPAKNLFDPFHENKFLEISKFQRNLTPIPKFKILVDRPYL